MAKESILEQNIGTIYKKSTLNLLMYGFVTGVRATLHTVTIENAVRMFMEAYNIGDAEYNIESGVATYGRMRKEFLNIKK